jgi:hypothetical protein
MSIYTLLFLCRNKEKDEVLLLGDSKCFIVTIISKKVGSLMLLRSLQIQQFNLVCFSNKLEKIKHFVPFHFPT